MSTAAAPATVGADPQDPLDAEPEEMTHRQILEALSGLLLGMFVAILSSTVVSNALPVIVPDLGGSESGYTWVVTAALLATTISTPVWGKLADLFSKKTLVQVSLVIFVVASAVAGLSVNMGMLIACRVGQGLGAGGLTALAQVIMAAMIAPRERGRYSGYLGATFALATVGGPLIGGVLTQHLSWHWCFYVGVPFAVLAFVVLQRTLHLPVVKREVHIDYLGATLIAAGVSSLLIWVSLAGHQFDWWSWETVAMVVGGIVLLALAVLVEKRAAEPIIPLSLFSRGTVVLSTLASLFVGVAMFGATIFLSQYFQLARGRTPTMSGLLTLPMIIGLFLSSTVAGQFITRTGRWKGWLVAGGFLLTAGLALMGTVEYDTDYWVVGAYMALIGLGVGMMMQNLVLAVQNVVARHELGTASSLVAFSRTLGGAIGVSALGAVLAHRVTDHLQTGLADAGIDAAQLGGEGGVLPDLSEIPEPVRTIVQSAYGSAISDIFLAAAPFGLVALILTFFFREIALRSSAASAPATVPQNQDPTQVPTSAAAAVATAPDGGSVDGAPALAGATVASAAAGVPRGEEAHPGAAAPVDGRPEERVRQETTETAPEDTAAVAPAAERSDRGLTLSGTVRQGGGEPFAEAVVTLADQGGRQVTRTSTGPDGRYVLDLPTGGTYLLIVAAPKVQPSASIVAVADRSVTKDVVLAGASAVSGRVLVRVYGPAGGETGEERLEGVPGAQVTLTDIQGEVVGTTRTDGHGGYAFAQLVGGAYVLTVQSPRYRPLARSVIVPDTGQLTCDLRVSGGGRLTGTVVSATDGSQVREASVTLVDGDGAVVGSTVTADDGSYVFQDLAEGSYTLTAAGYAPVATTVRVAEDEVAAVRVELGGAQ